MENKYFAELARRLRAAGITAGHPEKNRLTVLLNNQPVLSVSAGSDVFLLPAGSNQPEAGELYHKVAQTADEVYAYQNIGENGFTEADHIRLRDTLLSIQGKFLLSYNDDAFVRRLYDQPGIFLMETTRINNIKQRYDNGCQFPELIIANYDPQERNRTMPSQMTLFDGNGDDLLARTSK